MTKEFLTPSMEISRFDVENIVTDSVAVDTAVNATVEALGADASKDMVAKIKITW